MKTGAIQFGIQSDFPKKHDLSYLGQMKLERIQINIFQSR